MPPTIIQDLGDGLVLRRSCANDREPLSEFNASIHGESDADARAVADWTRDLLSGTHPTFAVDDCTIVEDTLTGKIVSTCNLISQIWSYEGIPFKIGRPELVATLPEYRRRGLVRLQFDVLHRWSKERGEMVQAITGIPYYYRQFGYEMALNLGGGCIGYQPQVPELAEGQSDPYLVRPAVEADLPFISRLYDLGNQRYPLSCVWNAELWRYELLGKLPENVNRMVLYIIEGNPGNAVGFVARSVNMWSLGFSIGIFEIVPGASWWAITPSVIRFIWKEGQDFAAQHQHTCRGFYFWLGEDHPCYTLKCFPVKRPPYAWYIRVPDLPAFLRLIAPALEKRLAGSACQGFTGSLKLSFYRRGLNMTFTNGHLDQVDGLPAGQLDGISAAFPDLTFLQLVFGYRSLAEIQYAFPDCWAADENARPLLDTLFPRRPSDVWPVS